jgi:hypothetical protein
VYDAQRYPGGAGVVRAGAGVGPGVAVGDSVIVCGPSGPGTTVVDGVVVGDVGLVVCPGDVVVVSVGLVVVVVVVVVVVAGSLGLRTWVRGTQV